jgi:hypothetical protein
MGTSALSSLEHLFSFDVKGSPYLLFLADLRASFNAERNPAG